MEDARALLSAALDEGGHICIVGLKPKSAPIQTFFAAGDYEGAVAKAMALDAAGYDAYWATSTFVTDTNRKAQNAAGVKVLKLDVDVGKGDDSYATKKEAVLAVCTFATDLGLPMPTFVDSGNGVHAYWILENALTPPEGAATGALLKALCHSHKLVADPTSTADIARILRVPGTHNRKNPNAPKPVLLKGAVSVHPNALVVDVIRALGNAEYDATLASRPVELFSGGAFPIPQHLMGVKMDDTTRSLVEGKPKKFSIIMKKSMEGKGCAQLLYIHDKQTEMSEPMWQAGLSVAWHCEDGEEAVKSISKAYHGYDEAETMKKAQGTGGPRTCAWFQQHRPEGCDGCKFAGKITSPIQLGEYVPRASKDDNKLMVQGLQADGSVNPTETECVIPEYPYPYFRGKLGGVFMTAGEDDFVEISKRDVYMVRRLRDTESGYLANIRVHHTLDGMLDFTIPLPDLSAPEKLQSQLSKNGILLLGKEVNLMQGYLRRYYEHMCLEKEVDVVKTQFGWTKDYKSFVIGDREITQGGWKPSHAAPSMHANVAMMTKTGTLEMWKKTFNTYAMPGFEANAFGALLGFASPLLGFTGYDGVVVNLGHDKSGTGKTTCLKAQSSIWGNHKAMIMSFDDTENAKANRMGAYKNIPFCIDETTETSRDVIAKFLFVVPNGRGKARMKSSVNEERANNTTWSLIATMSANTKFVQMLQAEHANSQGQLMRLLEVPVPPTGLLTKAQSDEIFKAFDFNFGWAGEEYIRHVIRNLDTVRANLSVEMINFDRDAGITEQKERFWSACCTCVYVGGVLAQEAGLHDIDMERIRDFMINLIRSMRKNVDQSAEEDEVGAPLPSSLRREAVSDVLGEFLNANNNNILTIDVDTYGTPRPPVFPRGELYVRYNRPEHEVWISRSAFRAFCNSQHVDFMDFLEREKAARTFIGDTNKRLAQGTPLPSALTRVLIFKVPEEDDAV